MRASQLRHETNLTPAPTGSRRTARASPSHPRSGRLLRVRVRPDGVRLPRVSRDCLTESFVNVPDYRRGPSVCLWPRPRAHEDDPEVPPGTALARAKSAPAREEEHPAKSAGRMRKRKPPSTTFPRSLAVEIRPGRRTVAPYKRREGHSEAGPAVSDCCLTHGGWRRPPLAVAGRLQGRVRPLRAHRKRARPDLDRQRRRDP